MNTKENGMNRKERMIRFRKNSLKFFNLLSEARGSLQSLFLKGGNYQGYFILDREVKN
jgi:hypothetical protein